MWWGEVWGTVWGRDEAVSILKTNADMNTGHQPEIYFFRQVHAPIEFALV